MRIRTTKTKNGRLFYVIKTYYDTKGVEHSVTVEKLGNENDIRAKHNMDPDVWAKEYVAKLNEKEKQENKSVQIELSRSSLITKDHLYTFNVGYLFLQSLYHRLKIDKICKQITERHGFKYDLDSILSRLIYGRILEPCSKRATAEFSETLLEKPNFDEHQIYRALDILTEESDFIQSELYKNSFALGKRHTEVIYYDCTNFFFEIEQSDEDGLRQYGKGKENRPLPIVEMGMFIDRDGIPLAICINPGNTNEQVTLKPIEKRIVSDYGMSKFIVCTDAGLSSKANRKFNDIQDRAFIVTQSIKKLKKELKEWALSPEGWLLSGAKNKRKKFDITRLDPERYKNSTFYKERWIDRGTFEEKIIVTFSLKYQNYQRKIRQGQVDRAQRAIDNGSAKRGKKNQNDFRRFISRQNSTDDGEIADNVSFSLDQDRIAEEEMYDGFYAVCTNIDDDPNKIISINQQRWEIEESFRIMKSDFDARPVYVRKDARIEAHFLTCFMALVLYRYLEKEVGEKYTCDQLLNTIQDMDVRELVGEGYIPCYTRTNITDDLHDAFGFRTDYQIVSKPDMKKLLKKSKLRKKK